jgi:hypothetical protein
MWTSTSACPSSAQNETGQTAQDTRRASRTGLTWASATLFLSALSRIRLRSDTPALGYACARIRLRSDTPALGYVRSDTPALRAVLWGNAIVHGSLLPIEIVAWHAGVITRLGGIVPNSVLLVVASGFLFFAW